MHADHDPVLGEIYVIAVDPDFHGARARARRSPSPASTTWPARACGTGMLYVDAANTAAVRLYERIGFTVHHSDRVFVAET